MKNKFSIAMTLAVIMAMLVTSLVLADQVVNNLDLSVDAAFETMALNVGGSNGSTTLRIIEQNGDGKNGCNLTGSSSQLTVSIASSNTSVATVSPSSVTFNSCGDTRVVTVMPVSQGSANITLSFVSVTTSSGGVTSSSFDLLPGRFTVNVAPPPNTAPVVSVTGVTHGSSYEFGSVPAAGCSVQDVEDGDSTFAASLSSISGALSAYGLGTQTATCSYTDLGGLTTTVEATYEIVDTTAPSISASAGSYVAGAWTNQDVTVHYTCTDGGSGVASVTSDQVFNTDGITASTSGTCTDHAGNSASASFGPIKIDKTAPGIAFVGPSTSSWYTADVTANWSCSDTLSGAVSGSVSAMTSGEGSAVPATGTCTDNAGNSASNTQNFMVDKTKPTISAAISAGTLGNNGWYVSNVTVHFTCNDLGSGIPANACPANQILSAEGTGISSTAQTVTDIAGNTSDQSNVVTVNIDKTAPSVSCGSADSAWHASDVSIACTAGDNVSGLADAADANFSLSTSVPTGTEDSNASTNSYAVYDAAGNSSIAGPVSGNMVDKKAPQLSGCDSPDGLWHANDVTLYCHYTDGGSGPAAQDVALTTSVAANMETNNASASAGGAQACDGVGNCAASPADIAGNKIDKKAPSITITTPANGSSYLLNQVVASVFNCTDGGSGAANCTGSATVDTASTGSKTFTVNATDNVGNSGSASTTYTVAFKICALYDQTKSHKSGSTVPLKLQLCDFNGVNYSSAAIIVRAISVTKLDNSASGILDDSGAANSPEMNFRYDATLGGSGGYIFNLSTKGLTTGTWKVTFTINGASDSSYFVRFDVK